VVNPVHGVRARPTVAVGSRKAEGPCHSSFFVPQGLGCGWGDDAGHYHHHLDEVTLSQCCHPSDRNPSQSCIRKDRRKQGEKRVSKGKPKAFLKLSWNSLI